MKRLAPVLILLLMITVMTSGVASAQPREAPVENALPMEPAMEPVGVDWMGVWTSYWWLVVIVIGLAAGLGLSFVFTRGLI